MAVMTSSVPLGELSSYFDNYTSIGSQISNANAAFSGEVKRAFGFFEDEELLGGPIPDPVVSGGGTMLSRIYPAGSYIDGFMWTWDPYWGFIMQPNLVPFDGAIFKVTGSSLSTDPNDANFTISQIRVDLMRAVWDANNPLASLIISGNLAVANETLGTAVLNSIVFQSDNGFRVSMSGPINFSATGLSGNGVVWEMRYDTDPGPAQILTTVRLTTSFSYNASTGQTTFTADSISFDDLQGHQFTITGLSLNLAQLETIHDMDDLVALALGNSGDKFILGGDAGNNTFENTAGADRFAGMGGDDVYVIDGADTVVEAVGAGNDTVHYVGGGSCLLAANVERLQLDSRIGNVAGGGNEGNNLLQGNDGSNILDGGAGNDQLYGYGSSDVLLGGAGNDLLNGGRGADLMQGGGGDDTYVVGDSEDIVVELAGAGTDTLISALRQTLLPDNVENLVLTRSGIAAGIGNGLANRIAGNGFANVLTGGGGADRFVFDAAPGGANVDTVTDFVPGADRLVFDNAVFSQIGPDGALAASAFAAGAGFTQGADAGDRIVFDTATGKLYYDADGLGGDASVLVVHLDGVAALVAADVVVA